MFVINVEFKKLFLLQIWGKSVWKVVGKYWILIFTAGLQEFWLKVFEMEMFLFLLMSLSFYNLKDFISFLKQSREGSEFTSEIA